MKFPCLSEYIHNTITLYMNKQTLIDPFKTSFPKPFSSSCLIAASAPSRPPRERNFFFRLTNNETSSIPPGSLSTNALLDCCDVPLDGFEAEPMANSQ